MASDNTGLYIFLFFVILILIALGIGIYYYIKNVYDTVKTFKPKNSSNNNSSNNSSNTIALMTPYSVLDMTGYYTVTSFNGGNTWYDVSGKGNHITDIRGQLSKQIDSVYGTEVDGFKFPSNVFGTTNNYTMFYFGKYNGDDRKKIITGDDDWFSGWSDEMSGVSSLTQDTNTNKYGAQYIYVMDQPGRVRVNGIEITQSVASNVDSNIVSVSNIVSNVVPAPTGISVNYGGDETQYSDFAFKEIVFYSKKLNNYDIKTVENYFATKYKTDLNIVQGLKIDANVSVITYDGGINESICRSKAIEKKSNAFAINTTEKKCIFYSNVTELNGWTGEPTDYANITMCTDITKDVKNGCA